MSHPMELTLDAREGRSALLNASTARDRGGGSERFLLRLKG
jgi:hypothetical protein